jgi:hypothetical protein
MSPVFKVLGVFVGLYVVYAALKGQVYVRSGAWGRTIFKRDSPGRFWTAIGVYAILSIALLTVF